VNTIEKDEMTMSGMTTDQTGRMLSAIRELDSRLWPGVLAAVIRQLSTDAEWDTDSLLRYLRDYLDDDC
jgi:hypothetical protein